MNTNFLRGTLTSALALGLIASSVHAESATLIETPSSLSWTAQAANDGMTLTVSGPADINERYAFKADESASFSIFDANGNTYPDGTYTWELRVTPQLNDKTRSDLEAAQVAGDELRLNAVKRQAGIEDPSRFISSGSFMIAGGQIVSRGLSEEGATQATTDAGPLVKAQTFATDLIVQGSECLGIDCSTSESFGFDTLKLKENNLRIKFDDTSASANFPGNDWQLTANESDNGGLNKFSIDDITGGKTPFTVEAGAPNNTLYAEDDGDVGIGTNNPAVRVHVVKGDSPALRLEQDGSSGFTPQAWDISGNESNFFVRDVTNGSKLPFKIKPGAPTDAMYVAADGTVGLGTDSPTGNGLHVKRALGPDAADLLTLENNGAARFVLNNSTAASWLFNSSSDGLRISDVEETANTEFRLDVDGNLFTSGTVNGVSDRNKKKDFETIDPVAVLDAVANLPMSTWSYKNDAQQLRHMGPMAQDFWAAFGLGMDDKHITITDMGGVALAAIQGLEARNSELAEQNAGLAERLEALEAMIEKLAAE